MATIIEDKIRSLNTDWGTDDNSIRLSGKTIEFFVRERLRMLGFLNMDLLPDECKPTNYEESGYSLATAILTLHELDWLDDEVKLGMVITFWDKANSIWKTFRYNKNTLGDEDAEFINSKNWQVFSGGSGDSGAADYVSRLAIIDSSNTVEITDPTTIFKIKYILLQNIGDGLEDVSQPAFLSVSSSRNGSTYVSLEVNIPGRLDLNLSTLVTIMSNQEIELDFSKFLTSGTNYVRVLVTNLSGGTSLVIFLITYYNFSTLYVGTLGAIYRPVGNIISLPFTILGEGSKELVINIKDPSLPEPNSGITFSFSESGNRDIDNPRNIEIDVTSNGANLDANINKIYKIEYWIRYSGNREIAHKTCLIMYAPLDEQGNLKDQTTCLVSLNNVVTSMDNWDTVTVFNFGTFNPAGDTLPLNIKMYLMSGNDEVIGEVEEDFENGVEHDFTVNLAVDSLEGIAQDAASIFFYKTGTNTTYIDALTNIPIYNTENFSYAKGATFVIDPLKKNITYTLDDDMDGSLQIDGTLNWTKQNDVPCLFIPRGKTVHFNYEVFNGNTGKYTGVREGSTVIELDVMTKNVIDDEAAIIDMFSVYNAWVPPTDEAEGYYKDIFTGFALYPERALIMPSDYQLPDFCDAGFGEEDRVHLMISISRDQSVPGYSGTVNLVRIFVNGVSSREYKYNSTSYFAKASGDRYTNDGITLGGLGSDLYIYNMRIYKGLRMSANDCFREYLASRSSVAEKLALKLRNDILSDSNEILYDKVNGTYNTILYKIPANGHLPSKLNNDSLKNVTIDLNIVHNFNGVADPTHSGTFYNMALKGQGTTAKTYYEWNQQWSFMEKTQGTLTVTIGKFVAKDEEGQSGSADDPGVAYYQLFAGAPKATKLVDKRNIASQCQSHKAGHTRMYDELYQYCVVANKSAREKGRLGRRAVIQLPFFIFVQIGNGDIEFHGFGTFGPGKGDKATFGYDKKKTPDKLMIEGADNDTLFAQFKIPFELNDDITVATNLDGIGYDTKEESFYYMLDTTKKLSWDFDLGSKEDTSDGGTIPIFVDRATGKAPTESSTSIGGSLWTLLHKHSFVHNFIFASNDMLKPFTGTAALLQIGENMDLNYHYWIPNGMTINGVLYAQYTLFRYCPKLDKWVQATFPEVLPTKERFNSLSLNDEDENGNERDVRMVALTLDQLLFGLKSAYEARPGSLKWDAAVNVDLKNDYFIALRQFYFNQYADRYIDVQDVLYHQVDGRVHAATDERTKNIYVCYDGYIYPDVVYNSEGDITDYGEPVINFLLTFIKDDTDTRGKTDNQGLLTKPYWILEHDKDSSGKNYWNGESNAFFNILDGAFESDIRNMMNAYFTNMGQLAGSIEKYMETRYYWIAEYFPEVAFNEFSKVCYEKAYFAVPELTVDPFSQITGNLVIAEKAWYEKRFKMLYGFAEYGIFATSNSITNALSFRSKEADYHITYTAYLYMYPKMSQGTSRMYGTDANGVTHDKPFRLAKGETVTFDFHMNDSNTTVFLYAMDMCSSLGNFYLVPAGSAENAMTVRGKRLTAFYGGNNITTNIKFSPVTIKFADCDNMLTIDLRNVKDLSSMSMEGSFNRLENLLLSGTSITSVPIEGIDTPELKRLTLPATITRIALKNKESLTNLTIDNAANILTFICENTPIDTMSLMSQIKEQQTLTNALLTRPLVGSDDIGVTIKGLEWTNCPSALLNFLVEHRALLTGSISMYDLNWSVSAFTVEEKEAISKLYGDVDDTNNSLYINYRDRVRISYQSFLIGETKLITITSIKPSYYFSDPPSISLSAAPMFTIVSGPVMSGEWPVDATTTFTYTLYANGVGSLNIIAQLAGSNGVTELDTISIFINNFLHLTRIDINGPTNVYHLGTGAPTNWAFTRSIFPETISDTPVYTWGFEVVGNPEYAEGEVRVGAFDVFPGQNNCTLMYTNELGNSIQVGVISWSDFDNAATLAMTNNIDNYEQFVYVTCTGRVDGQADVVGRSLIILHKLVYAMLCISDAEPNYAPTEAVNKMLVLYGNTI